MAIGEGTIEENSAKYTILMAENQTLTEALQRLFDNNKYPENDTYLVVTLPNAQYKVILFSDLNNILQNMGYDIPTQPLSDLPIIPPVSRVVSKDTTEAGLEILDWVDTHPQSTVVVTDAGKFVGLFVNPNRSGDSGLVRNLSLQELYGDYIKLGKDPRSFYRPEVDAPTCPLCQQKHFKKLDVEKNAYICPIKKGIVEQL
jgi:hypothetical protein